MSRQATYFKEKYKTDVAFRAAIKNRVKAWNLSIEGRCKRALSQSKRNARIAGYEPINATWRELAEALENQNYCCAITGISELDLIGRLHADHDHTTGKFRGWICPRANTALGFIEPFSKQIDIYLKG